MVPGNHDVYAKTPNPFRQSAHNRFERICKATEKSRGGENSEPLVVNANPPPDFWTFPFGKILSKNVVLVGLDTTTADARLVLNQGKGELDDEDLEAALDFLQDHEEVPHRIIVMHHLPYRANFDYTKIAEQNFAEPAPEEMTDWVEETGATLVLCGHSHETDMNEDNESYLVLVSGGCGGERTDDPHKRAFHLVDLEANGKMKTKKVMYKM